MTRINWIDILILIIIFRAAFLGLHKGIGCGIIPLVGNYATLIIATYSYSGVAAFVANHSPLQGPLLSFFAYIIIAASFISLSYIIDSFVVGRIMKVQVLETYDKIGGAIAGAMRGTLLVSIMVIALDIAPGAYIDYSLKEKSLLGRHFLSIGRAVYTSSADIFRL